MINLSETQKEIVTNLDGAILVKAGPGSGKTRVVTEKIKYILKNVKRSKVLSLTFSNMAAAEMQERLKEENDLDDLLENANICTIHSFCLDIVQNRGNLIGLPSNLTIIDSEENKLTILKDICLNNSEYKKMLNKNENPKQLLRRILQSISDTKRRFMPIESIEDPLLSGIYEEYNLQLTAQQSIDFDDILFYAYKILIENPNVSKLYSNIYKYICVDEAQDLNFSQYEIIKTICSNETVSIMLVGDENQSIYGFNGSDSKIMTKKFVEDFNPKIFTLHENFRSSKRVITFANSLVGKNSQSNYVYEGELQINDYESELNEAESIKTKIENLMTNGHKDIEKKLDFTDFAVIARNNYLFSKVETVFKEAYIPYQYKKSSSKLLFESTYINIFDISLKILVNKKDMVHLNELSILLNFTEDINLKSLESFEILEILLADSDYNTLLASLKIIYDDETNFKKSLNTLKGTIDSFNDEDKFLIINDISLWEKHWINYCNLVSKSNRTLLSFRNFISLGRTTPKSKDEGVNLLTGHMSKGLQYEVVFIIGLSEGTFPDYRALNSNDNELEQELNNFYVAVTRTKRLCYLSYSKYRQMPWGDSKFQKPSRYISKYL